MMKKRLLEAIATLIGITIGAGILGIPYVVSQSGIWIGLAHIFIIGGLILFVNLFMAEIVLRTKETHQMTGYAEKYLGRCGKWAMAITMMIGVYGALLAYTIGGGMCLASLLGGNPFWWSIGFFALCSFIILKGLNLVKETELLGVSAMLIIILIIIGIGMSNADMGNLAVGNGNIFLPYGVVLFAFIGMSAIPEMRLELRNNYRELGKAVVVGTLVSAFIYAFFAIGTVLVTGDATTPVATVGLGGALGPMMVLLSNVFAFFTMGTSFVILGLALKDMYKYDLKMGEAGSFLSVILVPLIIFATGFNDFITPLGIAGSLTGGIDGILAVLMLGKARELNERKPEFKAPLAYPLGIAICIMFLLGIVYQVASLLGLI